MDEAVAARAAAEAALEEARKASGSDSTTGLTGGIALLGRYSSGHTFLRVVSACVLAALVSHELVINPKITRLNCREIIYLRPHDVVSM